ncbi:unnamed protein product [Caenorhabditis brenneri]
MALSGILPRVLTTFGADSYTISCYYKAFSFTYLYFLINFFHKIDNLYVPKYGKHWEAILIIIGANFLALIVAIHQAIYHGSNFEVYIFHYYFTWLFIGSTIDCYVVGKDGVENLSWKCSREWNQDNFASDAKQLLSNFGGCGLISYQGYTMILTLFSGIPATFFVAYHLIIGTFYTILPFFHSSEEWRSFSTLLLYFILIFAIVVGLLQWYKNKDEVVRSTEQEKATRNVLTGLAGIALSGIIPRLLATIFGADGHTMYCYFKLFNCSCLLFSFAFFHDIKNYVDLKLEDYQKHFNAIKIVVIFHLLGLILAIQRAFADGVSTEVYLFHYFFTMMFMASSIEFYVYWKDGVHLRNPR